MVSPHASPIDLPSDHESVAENPIRKPFNRERKSFLFSVISKSASSHTMRGMSLGRYFDISLRVRWSAWIDATITALSTGLLPLCQTQKSIFCFSSVSSTPALIEFSVYIRRSGASISNACFERSEATRSPTSIHVFPVPQAMIRLYVSFVDKRACHIASYPAIWWGSKKIWPEASPFWDIFTSSWRSCVLYAGESMH